MSAPIELFYKYSSSSLTQFLNGARDLNLLSAAFKYFNLGCPFHASLTFSSLLCEMSKYSSDGNAKLVKSANLLLDKSKYLRWIKFSSAVKTVRVFILFL